MFKTFIAAIVSAYMAFVGAFNTNIETKVDPQAVVINPTATSTLATSTDAGNAIVPPEATKVRDVTPVVQVTKKPVVETTVPKTAVKEPSQPIKITEDDFRESIIIMFGKSREGISRFLQETKGDIQELEDRRFKVQTRINDLKKVSFPNSGDGIPLNEALGIYIEMHQQELDYISNVIEYINSNIKYLEAYRNTYSTNIQTLFADKKTPVTRDDFLKAADHEMNITSENIYKAETNILESMKKFASSVIYKEGQYEKYGNMLLDGAEFAYGSSVSPSTIYQPLPQINYQLTARQELLLNPITCTVKWDIIQGTVQCY